MRNDMIYVEGVAPVEKSDVDDVRAKVWSYALDQRVFGPRKLFVAFTDASGQLLVLTHATRTRDPLLSLEASLDLARVGATAAVACCDEPVTSGAPSPSALTRFDRARALAACYNVHLVDWFACDDEVFLPMRLRTFMVDEQPDWWDVPMSRESGLAS